MQAGRTEQAGSVGIPRQVEIKAMTPFFQNQFTTLYQGDCREIIKALPDESVNCVVTSPPYFGLRDYGTATWEGGNADCDHVTGRVARTITDASSKQITNNGAMMNETRRTCPRCGALRIDSQIGLEESPAAYVEQMVEVFREVRRVLRADGTCWLNLGDSFAGAGYSNHANTGGTQREDGGKQRHLSNTGLKPKDLCMIPHRTAIALQNDGWWVRMDCVWNKPNPMPESVTDRPTKAHEYIFLLSKSATYYYNADAIREPNASPAQLAHNIKYAKPYAAYDSRAPLTGQPGNVNNQGIHARPGKEGRNRRSVWTISPTPYPDAHFATFPPDLIKPCILAGCTEGGTVLDPFAGSGTTLQVAMDLQCKSIGIELNADYCEFIKKRFRQPALMFGA